VLYRPSQKRAAFGVGCKGDTSRQNGCCRLTFVNVRELLENTEAVSFTVNERELFENTETSVRRRPSRCQS
jgi:hypothetical protein